jgi:hypothetical protein
MYNYLKVNALYILCIFSLLGPLFIAKELRGEPSPFSIEDLTYIFSTYFPKIEGSITELEGDKGKINLGRKNGLVTGVVLEIVRPAEHFFHPLTHQEMGRFEEKIGFIEVERIDENQSGGTVKIFEKGPQPGDLVRISSARIPVLISGEQEKRNMVILDEFSKLLVLTDRFLNLTDVKSDQETSIAKERKSPVYEFKVHSMPDQTVQVELVNLPFQHTIDKLVATANGNLP